MSNPFIPLMAAAGFGSHFLGKSKDDDIPYWDWTRDYYMFPPEFTNLIDEILESPYGLVTQQIITSDSRNIPGTGFHYFFDQTKNNRTFWDNKFRYITFEKKTKKVTKKASKGKSILGLKKKAKKKR